MNLSIDSQRSFLASMASLWRGEGMLHWRIFQPRYPPLAVEVGDGCLHLASLERTKDKEKKLILRRYARVEMPEGALRMQFAEPNVVRPADVLALRQAEAAAVCCGGCVFAMRGAFVATCCNGLHCCCFSLCPRVPLLPAQR